MKCRNSQDETCFQPFPERGEPLEKRVDLKLKGFDRKEPPQEWGQDIVYVYVIDTLDVTDEGLFRQRGSAPNFQGGLISLCTCKHRMRTWGTIEKGVWIAGFSGQTRHEANHLFFLMQIGYIELGFRQLWQSYSREVRESKSACNSIYGDCYMSKDAGSIERPHDPESYRCPILGHKHHRNASDDSWKGDVSRGYQRTMKLLCGDLDRSFLWRTPVYRSTGSIGRGVRRFESMRDLYERLEGPA